ncbi:hypothetical protein Tco_0396798 [Tanacetum coccineum]
MIECVCVFVCEIQIVVRKKVNSRYVVENVLMGCGGAYGGNERDKRLEEGFEDKILVPVTSSLKEVNYACGFNLFTRKFLRVAIEILKRLQREAFSDLMKLRDRQDKVERILSFKSSKGGPFDDVSTRVRGEVEALGLLLMIDRMNEEYQDAISRTGIKTGVNSRFTFETTVRENDSLTAEFVACGKAQLDAFASPLSLAKVVYAANINDWCSLVVVPLGAKCSDVGPSKSSHQERGLTSHSCTGPLLLNQHIGSGISVTVKKSNIIASLAQFASVLGTQLDSQGTTLSLSTFVQLVYQISWNTKLSVLGLHQAPKFSNQHASLGPIALPIGIFKHKDPFSGSLRSTAMVVESELDTSTRIGGWVEMNNSGTRHLQWGASISDLPEDDFGWGLRLGGTIEGLKDWDHYQVEGFSKINFGEKFSVQPSLVYVKNGSTHFPALMMKSSWSF